MSCGVSSAGIVGTDAAGTLSRLLSEPSGFPPGSPGRPPSTLLIVLVNVPSPGIDGSEAGAVETPSTDEPGAGAPRWASRSGVVGCSSVFRPTIARMSMCAGTLGAELLARNVVPLAW